MPVFSFQTTLNDDDDDDDHLHMKNKNKQASIADIINVAKKAVVPVKSTIQVRIGNVSFSILSQDIKLMPIYGECRVCKRIVEYELEIKLFSKKEFMDVLKGSLNPSSKFFH